MLWCSFVLVVHLILFYVTATLVYVHILQGARGNMHVIMHGSKFINLLQYSLFNVSFLHQHLEPFW